MKPIVRYKNGNYTVTFNTIDGTKIRENNENFFQADFPESMDLKITNRCHNACPWCHEVSTCNGAHGDILSPSFIDKLHPYTEIALGGGNPLEHPDLIPFLEKLKGLNIIPSMTIRQNDFMDNLELINELVRYKLIYGIGISLVEPTDEFIAEVKKFPNAIIHVINGVVEMRQLEKLSGNHLKILILGYKEVGRGKALHDDWATKIAIEGGKDLLYGYLDEIIRDKWFDVISFDNLAIKQLYPQRLMDKTTWDEMYMGDDGIDGKMTSASMYIDMVERKFALNSCAPQDERFPLIDTIDEMYKFLCDRYNKNVE